MLSITFRFVRVIPAIPIRRTSARQDFFVVQGYYERNGNEEELYCGIKRRQKKAFKRNKKEYDRLSDHIGFAPLVMAAPSDNELILGGSEERRKEIGRFVLR